MIFERLYPAPAEAIDADDRGRLLDAYRPPAPEWLRVNLVTSVTGSAAGADGTSQTLSSKSDRKILGVIRELADVVLIGAESLRTEGYVQPRNARLAVVTLSGNLAGHRVDLGAASAPIVVCPPKAAEGVLAELPSAEVVAIEPSERGIESAALVSALRDRGLASIVCEGGPSLVGQLLSAALVDELCLTTSPRLGGANLAATGDAVFAQREATLHQLMRDEESALYARWLVQGRQATR